MALFDDLVSGPDGVYTLTNRSDLVAETALAVRQATLRIHRAALFPRDVVEGLLVLTPLYNYQLDIPTYFPRWRQFSYLRPYTNVSQSPAPFFIEFMRPDAIFDAYGAEKTNVGYVAGNNLNVKLGPTNPSQTVNVGAPTYDSFLYGYYANPVLTPAANYESWIAREHPSTIVMDAAAIVFRMIGYEEAAARFMGLVWGPGGTPQMPTSGGEVALLISSSLEEQGR